MTIVISPSTDKDMPASSQDSGVGQLQAKGSFQYKHIPFIKPLIRVTVLLIVYDGMPVIVRTDCSVGLHLTSKMDQKSTTKCKNNAVKKGLSRRFER